MTRIPRTPTLAIGFIVAAATFLGAQDAAAARIYNFTNQPIEVTLPSKGKERKVSLKPGEKSESLEWSVALPFKVWHPFAFANGTPICDFQVNTREIVGGNYLLVVQQGDTVTCTLCEANRKVRFMKSGKLKPGNDYTTKDHKPNTCE